MISIRLALFSFVFLLIAACAKTEGTVVEGRVEQAAGLQVQFDKLNGPTEAFEQLTNTVADAAGNFVIELPETPEAGVYRVRIGARKMPLVLDGTEERITLNGKLDDLPRYQYSVTGSKAGASFQKMLGGLAMQTYSPEDAVGYLDTVANPWAGVYLAELALGHESYLEGLRKAQTRLEAEYTGTAYGTDYAAWVNAIEADFERRRSEERIQVGQPAPNIELPSPSGESYALDDLKGKVVLLDFWAAWCGPCRRANPTVVDVYERYKDKGFTVYSVSLDGLDDNSRARLSQSGDLDAQVQVQREKWVQAIAADRLSWPYHVSDLKKWSAMPAQTYGVSGIPKTFLIDREGKIAAVNVNHTRLEEELKGLL